MGGLWSITDRAHPVEEVTVTVIGGKFYPITPETNRQRMLRGLMHYHGHRYHRLVIERRLHGLMFSQELHDWFVDWQTKMNAAYEEETING
jgi:hypothetical protein